jgi:hypothetical protein
MSSWRDYMKHLFFQCKVARSNREWCFGSWVQMLPLFWNASLTHFEILQNSKQKKSCVHLHMLRAHKILPWKLICRLGCVKRQKKCAKNKAFCETCFVFFHIDHTIYRFFPWNYANPHRLLRCKCKKNCWYLLTIRNIFFGWREHMHSGAKLNFINIFGNWLNSVDHRFKLLIRVRELVVIWSIWLCKNYIGFNDKNSVLMEFIYNL